jgi:hypothetical protein
MAGADKSGIFLIIVILSFFIYFAVPELELRAYTLSHSTSPFL